VGEEDKDQDDGMGDEEEAVVRESGLLDYSQSVGFVVEIVFPCV
jgi:hypothetical protein